MLRQLKKKPNMELGNCVLKVPFSISFRPNYAFPESHCLPRERVGSPLCSRVQSCAKTAAGRER
jgi:hypothetical protein